MKSGGGTGGSRSIPLGGVSASRAGEALKIRRIAADELEAAAADISDDGEGASSARPLVSFADVARAAKKPEDLQGFGEFVQDEATTMAPISAKSRSIRDRETEIVGYDRR